MDSSRQFITTLPHDSNVWGWSFQDRQKLQADSAATYWPPTESHLFDMDEFITSLHLEVLRLVFLCVDVLLLLYRFSHLYLATRTLCQGFEESITISDVDIKKTTSKLLQYADQHTEQLIPLQTDVVMSDYHNSVEVYKNHSTSTLHKDNPDGDAALLERDIKDRTSHKQPNGNAMPVQQSLLRTDSVEGSGSAPISLPILTKPEIGAWTKLLNIGRVFLDKLVNADIVPKCLFGLLVIFALYVVLQFAHTMVCAETLAAYGAFDGFATKVTTHLSSTNHYLEWLGREYTLVLRDAYSKFMESEFLHIQSLVQYFNDGR